MKKQAILLFRSWNPSPTHMVHIARLHLCNFCYLQQMMLLKSMSYNDNVLGKTFKTSARTSYGCGKNKHTKGINWQEQCNIY